MVFSKLLTRLSEKSLPTPTQVVGIDIGSSSVKIVELEKRDGVVTLTTYGELLLAPYANSENLGDVVVLSTVQQRQALVDVIRESAAKAPTAVFSIPLAWTFITTLSIDVENVDDDISSRIRIEARKYIPIPIANVTMDWVLLSTSSKAVDNKVIITKDVLLVALQNDFQNTQKILKDSTGFSSAPNEVECFSVVRSLHNENISDYAIIDIGALTSKLYIVKDGLVIRTHRVRAGGAQCTYDFIKINDHLNFSDAESLKRTITSQDEQFMLYQKIHHNAFIRVLVEFQQVINESVSRFGGKLEKVFITGGVTQFPQFPQFVSDQLRIPVQTATPFEKVAYPVFMEEALKKIGPTFTPAVGAALRVFE